jgi:hypothetical protein
MSLHRYRQPYAPSRGQQIVYCGSAAEHKGEALSTRMRLRIGATSFRRAVRSSPNLKYSPADGPEIGATLPRDAWAVSPVKNLVAVHRLREVSCLYGFTRFEAAPTSADRDLEDIQLKVRGRAACAGCGLVAREIRPKWSQRQAR